MGLQGITPEIFLNIDIKSFCAFWCVWMQFIDSLGLCTSFVAILLQFVTVTDKPNGLMAG